VRDKSRLLNKYLKYYFELREFRELFETWAGAGSTRAYLGITAQGKLPVRLPPIDVQRAITDVVSPIDDKIELNRRTNETLEAMARALFRDWFVDFGPTRAKMEGRAPYLAPDLWALFPDRLDDATGVPEEWAIRAASDLFEFNPRETIRKGAGAPYLDMAALPTTGPVPDAFTRREYKSGTKFRDGDTVFARITPCLENGKTAYVFGLGDGIVGAGSTEFIVIRSREPVPAPVSYLLARDAAFRRHAERSMTGTSGRQRANAEALMRYELVSPPDHAVWEALGRLLEPMLARVIANAHEARTLAQTRDLLLPKLMSGEIRLRAVEEIIEEVA
jgi:type I restriction enzyme S subunit